MARPRAFVICGLLCALALAPVQAQQAGPAVTVAVVDSGIDATHAEFGGRVRERASFVTPVVPPVPGVPGLPTDPFALRLDPDGQGTGVASRVAGDTFGVSKDAGLVDLQVSAKYTGTALDPQTEAAAAQAMDWLLNRTGGNGSANPRVVLLSFASRDLSGPGAASLAAQAQGLWQAGVLVVVPAGAQSPLHSSPYVVTVAGSEAKCEAPDLTPANPLKPDLSAPSTDLEAANPSDPTDPQRPSTIKRSGTPYAAAQVAGAAAEAWKARPDLSVSALASILRDSADDVAAAGPDGCTGHGALDVAAVVAAAKAWSDPMPTDPLAKPTPGWAVAATLGVLGLVAFRRRR